MARKSNFEKKAPVIPKSKIEHTIEIGIFDEETGEVKDSHIFVGVPKKCTDWLKQTYLILQIKSFFKSMIVISIDGGEWKTFDMMKEEGIVV